MKQLLIKYGAVLFALSLFHCSGPSGYKHRSDRKLGIRQLQNDFTVLRRTLEEAHPGLYWYTARPAMGRCFDSSYALLDHPMTRQTFFKLLLPLIARVRCVHTSLRMGQAPEGGPDRFVHLLPFDFLCRGEKLFITGDFTGSTYAGAEILSVDHIPARKIIRQLLTCLPADGYNETYKYHLLNTGAFREGYALYYGQPAAFTLELRGHDTSKRMSVAAKAATPGELAARLPRQPLQPVVLDFRDDLHLAVLSVNTFEMSTKKFLETIVPAFKTMQEKRVERLIIDLRRNGGGNSNNVPELFAFLATRPFLHLKKTEMSAPAFTYMRYVKNPQDFARFHGVKQPDGSYAVNSRYAGTAYRDPVRQYGFRGETILLTSGNTTSAASEFAAIARYNGRVFVVGEETGGCYYGATGGNYVNLVLPASKLEARIPAIRIFTAVSEDPVHPAGRGLVPDSIVVPAVNDILQGRDVQLEAAMGLVKKKGK